MSIIKYLPNYMAVNGELIEICLSEDSEINKAKTFAEDIPCEFLISSATEYGVSRYEKFFEIEASGDESIDYRKFRLKMKMAGDKSSLIDKINSIITDMDYIINFDTENFVLEIKLPLVNKNYLAEVRDMLDNMLPANIELICGVLYATHKTLGAYRHSELKSFSHTGMREMER